MADTGMSAIKQPPRERLHNMRTWRTFGVAGDCAGGQVGTLHSGPRAESRFPLPCYAGRDRISCQDTRVSSIWTPSGEHQPDSGRDPGHEPGTDPGPEGEAVEMTQEQYQELLRARAELAAIPVADIVANHAIGLQQLAVIHLLPDPDIDGNPGEPRLAEASLAIDALGALVDTLGDRLAPHHEALREAVSQLRLAFVELSVTE